MSAPANTDRRRRGRRLRARLPITAVVLCCVTAVVIVVSGAASTVPGLQFLPPGHWVFNAALQSVFHVDGATASVDAVAEVPGSAGSLVVQGDTSGYVVGDSRITEFGKSSLEVSGEYDAPSGETPVGVGAAGGPYLVYRDAGKVVRLGEEVVTLSAGGAVGEPVVTEDGTLWLPRVTAGLLCRLPAGADTITCPVRLPADHTGAMSVVADRPVFVDTAADVLHEVVDDELGPARPLGVDASAKARAAGTDADGKVVILDGARRLHLVETDSAGTKPKPVTVELPADGQYDGPVTTGAVIALVDRTSGTLLTYDADGTAREQTPIPDERGEPRLTRGEDDRVYVDGAEGEHVLVVDRDGTVTDVPVVAEQATEATAATEADEERARDETGPGGAVPPQGPPQESPHQDSPQQSPQPQPEPETPVVPASPPGAPAGVQATPGDATATVTWGAAPDNRAPITGYTISWPGGQLTAPPDARSATATGLANGTSYAFTVTATNSAGTGPGATSNAVIPVSPIHPASAPTNLAGSYDRAAQQATLSWAPPSDLGGGQVLHYVATAMGIQQQTVTGTSATFTDLNTDGDVALTVYAVTQTPDGQRFDGAVANTTAAGQPSGQNPTLTLARGADTESEACVAPDCSWLNVTLTGFAPNTTYTIGEQASEWGEFSEDCVTTTDATGSATCDETRFDGAGQEVWVFTDGPNGTVESNRLYWEPR